MELGTLNELVNTRSVIKHIRKHNKDMKQGAGIGNDFSLVNDVVSCEGVSANPYIAWVKAMNNLAVSYAKPIGVRLVMLLPGSVSEADIKLYMKGFNSLADEEDIQILGGHTEVGRAYNHASFVVTVYGSLIDTVKDDNKKIKPGDRIIMLGYAGLMGTDIIARSKRDELGKRFALSYIEGAYFNKDEYAIRDKVRILVDIFGKDVLYMHDVSHGGIYGALWQLGVKIKHGISVNHANIPIKQETVEICEFFDINPYMLDGTGAVIAVVRDESENCADKAVSGKGIDGVDSEKRTEDMKFKKGLVVATIGRITDDNDKVVMLGDEKNPEQRFLSPVKGDEIYKVI
ncbi:MAG: hypothetical protein IJ224_09570 [Lachnospiraceae bacterium]|nr:hypothetical protein [Lachnospiraceae bacterium]